MIYFAIISFAYKRYPFLQFLLITFMFLACYLSFINYFSLGVDEVIMALSKRSLPLFLYCNFLLPGVFFSYAANFYILTNEVSGMTKNKVAYFIIPVLIKRELIVHRYNTILESLYTRGINTKSFINKYLLLPLWIVPLFITTLMEGVESYEYNRMLKVNILNYNPTHKKYYTSWWQKLSLFLIVCLFVLKIIL